MYFVKSMIRQYFSQKFSMEKWLRLLGSN